MIIGHIPNSFVIHQLLALHRYRISLKAFLISNLIPDIVDKTFSILLGLPGRGITHTIIIPTFVYLFLIIVLPKIRTVILAVIVGHYLHLIQDTVSFQLVLWPLWGDFYYYDKFKIMENFTHYYIHFEEPLIVTIEMISILLAGVLLGKKHSAIKSALFKEDN